MSFFEPQRETVDLGGGNYITLRAITYGEQQTITDDSLKMGAQVTGEQTGASIQFATGHMNLSVLKKMIVDWSGPKFMVDGQKVPVVPENIEKLPPWIGEKIIREYAPKLNSGLSEAEKKQ